MAESDLRAERLKKLELLKKAGMEPYPARVPRTLSIGEFLEQFQTLEENKKEESLAGRIMSLREQGSIIFADIFDGTGKVQLVIKEGDQISVEEFGLFLVTVDQSDFISATGTAFTTKRGEKSLQVKNWQMAGKSLMPIPDQWFGIKDEETRLRLRPLDLLLNQDLHAMVERRAKFWRSIRQFLEERNFLEVETPVLETSPGGADARPFITHHNALNMEVYLRISAGELWQKRLLIAGFQKVFEIGRIFRNEGQSREHLQDYTQLETYEAYSDYKKGMEFIKELYRHIAKEVYGKYDFEIGNHKIDLSKEWPVLDFGQLIKEEFGLDPISEIYIPTGNRVTESDLIKIYEKIGEKYIRTEYNINRAVDDLWKIIRKKISGPAFLVGIPDYMEPLAKHTENGKTVERVQVLLAGSEVGKGYSELNDPVDQSKRFNYQQDLRDAGDEEAQRLDESYLRDMEYGMPPAFGFGVSERLFAFFENKPIHEVQLFPLLRPKE